MRALGGNCVDLLTGVRMKQMQLDVDEVADTDLLNTPGTGPTYWADNTHSTGPTHWADNTPGTGLAVYAFATPFILIIGNQHKHEVARVIR